MNADTGLSIAVLRSCAVLVPMLLLGVLWVAESSARVRGAALLALLWNCLALLLLNALAVQQHWWSFGTDGGMWSGVPVDVVVGWAALWGGVPILFRRWVRPATSAVVLVVADVVAMGSLGPLVDLSSTWWWGEVLAVSLALVPGIVLGNSTACGTALRTRAGLQVILFGLMVGFVLPTVAFEAQGTGWRERLENIGGVVDCVLLQIGAVMVIIAVRAVSEFVAVGCGTPYPWDPPTRLVTTGPYRYVANPMQSCAVVLLLSAGALFSDPLLLVAAAGAVAFSAGLAAWHERAELADRHGAAWTEYRRHVRDWLPRWSPYEDSPARLYASVTCDLCSTVGPWFGRRASGALEVVPAEHHYDSLTRVRYEGATTLEGTRAIGAALEHVSLGWAVVGWLMRAPGVAWFLQVLVDAAGGGPRSVSKSE